MKHAICRISRLVLAHAAQRNPLFSGFRAVGWVAAILLHLCDFKIRVSRPRPSAHGTISARNVYGLLSRLRAMGIRRMTAAMGLIVSVAAAGAQVLAPAQDGSFAPPQHPHRNIHYKTATACPGTNPAGPIREAISAASPVETASPIDPFPAGKAGLAYYGGPVISNVQIVVVYWNSNVDPTMQAQMPGFFQGVVNSSWFDLLSEYSTDVKATGYPTSTNQSIGRGTYGGAFIIVPATCPATSTASCQVTDDQVQTELENQITKGVLPAPQFDSAGNTNTLYMTFFPVNVSINYQGWASCKPGGFCAYHNTGTFQEKPLLYGIIPDQLTSACSSECGDSNVPLDNATSTISHVLSVGCLLNSWAKSGFEILPKHWVWHEPLDDWNL